MALFLTGGKRRALKTLLLYKPVLPSPRLAGTGCVHKFPLCSHKRQPPAGDCHLRLVLESWADMFTLVFLSVWNSQLFSTHLDTAHWQIMEPTKFLFLVAYFRKKPHKTPLLSSIIFFCKTETLVFLLPTLYRCLLHG